ncbi:hypothetical protein NEQG_00107 [Nematocida parisii ERTm3]|uniref:Uncharacterized protein n=1 Tax=Nematocida parisii (strain ERTm3) TaxID=935791 RepID=I3EJE0_NEMP3|nr:hypothetical protein NEQG_00107 [Nematocida parisii ERTm3]
MEYFSIKDAITEGVLIRSEIISNSTISNNNSTNSNKLYNNTHSVISNNNSTGYNTHSVISNNNSTGYNTHSIISNNNSTMCNKLYNNIIYKYSINNTLFIPYYIISLLYNTKYVRILGYFNKEAEEEMESIPEYIKIKNKIIYKKK